MCDIHRQFILCSCAVSSELAQDPLALTWILARHTGYNDFSMEGILAFPSQKIADSLRSQWVESQLNTSNCFDFDYKPEELDELRIYQGPDRTYEPMFLSFIFRDARWHRDEFHGFESSKKRIHQGKLEFAEKTRLNTLRSFIVAELKKQERKYSLQAAYLHSVMFQLEHYDPGALETEEDLELLLEMMLQKAFEGFGKDPAPEPSFVRQFDIGFQRAGKHPKILPTVPLRRPLGIKEWYELWDRFQKKLGTGEGAHTFDEQKIEEWKQEIAKASVTLYQLDRFNHEMSYELSSFWVPEMLHGDDSFWTDLEFTWSITCDSYGYFHTKGSLQATFDK